MTGTALDNSRMSLSEGRWPLSQIARELTSPLRAGAEHRIVTPAAKGGAADDIGRLTKGEFYFSTEGLSRPIKVRTPLCLSWHSQNPPTAEEVVQKASAQSA